MKPMSLYSNNVHVHRGKKIRIYFGSMQHTRLAVDNIIYEDFGARRN